MIPEVSFRNHPYRTFVQCESVNYKSGFRGVMQTDGHPDSCVVDGDHMNNPYGAPSLVVTRVSNNSTNILYVYTHNTHAVEI